MKNDSVISSSTISYVSENDDKSDNTITSK